MAYCIKCGAKVNDGVRTCPQCGAEVPVMGNGGGQQNQDYRQSGGQQYQDYRQAGNGQYQGYQNQQSYTYQKDGAEYFDPQDVRQNKVMGVLAYLGILVLVPLLARDKNSEYAKFHTNQGLVLFLVNVAADLLTGGSFLGLHSLLYFDFWPVRILRIVVSIATFVLFIMGIVNACRGEKQELPIIGKLRILK